MRCSPGSRRRDLLRRSIPEVESPRARRAPHRRNHEGAETTFNAEIAEPAEFFLEESHASLLIEHANVLHVAVGAQTDGDE